MLPHLSLKPTHLICAAAALVVLLVGYMAFIGGGPVKLANTLPFMCIETGTTFAIARTEVNTIPLKHPTTGRPTLFPYEVRDGQNVVPERYRMLMDRKEDEGITVAPIEPKSRSRG